MSIGRADGRSNAQVILDYVIGAEPGTVFTFDELGEILAEGTLTRYPKGRLSQIVRTVNPQLLKRDRRMLVCQRGVGYAIAPAEQHLTQADIRKAKARRNLKYATTILQNTDTSQLDPNTRMLHTAQLLILGAVCTAVQALESRQNEHEEHIRRALGKIDERLSTAGIP